MWRRFTDNRAALFLSRAIENEEKQPIMNIGSSALKCNGNWFIYSWLCFESTWNIEKNLHYVILDKRDSRLSVGLWFTFMLSVFMPHSIFMPNKKKTAQRVERFVSFDLWEIVLNCTKGIEMVSSSTTRPNMDSAQLSLFAIVSRSPQHNAFMRNRLAGSWEQSFTK